MEIIKSEKWKLCKNFHKVIYLKVMCLDEFYLFIYLQILLISGITFELGSIIIDTVYKPEPEHGPTFVNLFLTCVWAKLSDIGIGIP